MDLVRSKSAGKFSTDVEKTAPVLTSECLVREEQPQFPKIKDQILLVLAEVDSLVRSPRWHQVPRIREASKTNTEETRIPKEGAV